MGNILRLAASPTIVEIIVLGVNTLSKSVLIEHPEFPECDAVSLSLTLKMKILRLSQI
jgi:hypothetical protein